MTSARSARRAPSGYALTGAVVVGVLATCAPGRAEPEVPKRSEATANGAPPSAAAHGDAPHNDEASQVLRVGYAGSAPFVLDGTADGLSVEVWRLMADGAGLSYRLSPKKSVAAALESVARGELDAAVGPISITSERARRVRFTQPYFQSQIGILTDRTTASFWSRLAPFLAKLFAGASLGLILSLVGVGTLVWLAERKKNPEQFPIKPARGIANGVWFALVTMTTVGYGDRAPVTPTGRAVTGVWMLVALVSTSSLTAGVASAFTVSQLDVATVRSARDLHDREVAVVKGTTSETFAREQGAEVRAKPDLASAVHALREREVIAVVHDKPILRYYLAKHPDSALRLAEGEYEPQGYGFAISPERDLVPRLNVSLLLAQEEGRVQKAVQSWLSED